MPMEAPALVLLARQLGEHALAWFLCVFAVSVLGTGIAAIIVVYMLFFADSGERAVVQGLLMGSVVAVMVATLLLIGVLDRPYRAGPGELRPVVGTVSMDSFAVRLDRELPVGTPVRCPSRQ